MATSKIVYHGKFSCKQLEHYYQRKRLWLVHILKRDNFYEIYYEKMDYAMLFGFGISCDSIDLEYAFVLAWANLDNYKGMFDDV